MAAPSDIRVNVTFEIMQESYLELRDVHAMTLADMLIWKNVAQGQAKRIAELESELAILRLAVAEHQATPAQTPE